MVLSWVSIIFKIVYASRSKAVRGSAWCNSKRRILASHFRLSRASESCDLRRRGFIGRSTASWGSESRISCEKGDTGHSMVFWVTGFRGSGRRWFVSRPTASWWSGSCVSRKGGCIGRLAASWVCLVSGLCVMRRGLVSWVVHGVGRSFLGCVLVVAGRSTASWGSESCMSCKKWCIGRSTASWVFLGSGLHLVCLGFVSPAVRGVGRGVLGCFSVLAGCSTASWGSGSCVLCKKGCMGRSTASWVCLGSGLRVMRRGLVSWFVHGVGRGFLGCVSVVTGRSTASWGSESCVSCKKGCIGRLSASSVGLGSGLRFVRHGFVSWFVCGFGCGFLGCVLVVIGRPTASWLESRGLCKEGCIG
jgi:hypothetical protein